MLRILGTIFAALLGLAFGSFLNVCLSRWPEGESVVHPRSHCRTCNRTLAWWENLPVLSWLVLRARCRTCGARIGVRYVLVEAAVASLWAVETWRLFPDPLPESALALAAWALPWISAIALCWLLVALAILDAENLWLPDFLTLPGISLGLAIALVDPFLLRAITRSTGLPLDESFGSSRFGLGRTAVAHLIAALAAATAILAIRWVYWILRRKEGIGIGDAKLMAMLGAWLGFSGALLSFALGVLLGALAAVTVLVLPELRRDSASGSSPWSAAKLPLGTFLCIGGLVSVLCGRQIVAAYLRWAGF